MQRPARRSDDKVSADIAELAVQRHVGSTRHRNARQQSVRSNRIVGTNGFFNATRTVGQDEQARGLLVGSKGRAIAGSNQADVAEAMRSALAVIDQTTDRLRRSGVVVGVVAGDIVGVRTERGDVDGAGVVIGQRFTRLRELVARLAGA